MQNILHYHPLAWMVFIGIIMYLLMQGNDRGRY